MKFLFEIKACKALQAEFDAIRDQIAFFQGEAMTTLGDFQEQAAAIRSEVARIATRIEELVAQGNRTDMTAEDEAAATTELSEAIAALKQVGVTPAE